MRSSLLLLTLTLALAGADPVGRVHASSVPVRTDGAGAATDPALRAPNPLDALVGPPSSQFT